MTLEPSEERIVGYRKPKDARAVSERAVHEEKSQARIEESLAKANIRRLAGAGFEAEERAALRVDAAIAAIDRLDEEHIGPLVDLPGMEDFREALRKRRKEFGGGEVRGGEALDWLKRLLRRCRFKGNCPRCEGAGCGECRGRGWVNNGMWAKMKNEERNGRKE